MTKEETYTITGMSCAACSSAVERVTRKIAGVESSSVNLATGRMTISYDPQKVNPELIAAKVERAGFGCQPFQVGCQPFQRMSSQTTTIAGGKTQNDEDGAENQSCQEETSGTKGLRKRKRGLAGAWLFTLALMYVSMGSMLPRPLPLPELVESSSHPTNFALLQLLLSIPVLFFGRFFYINGFSALLHRNPNMNSLVALGSIVSFVYSLASTFLVADNPHQLHHLYYESATMVLTFVMTGKYLEERSKQRTKGAIRALMELAPDTAFVVQGEVVQEIPSWQLVIGDLILVKPGSRIPADGAVVRGTSAVDESMLTGESIPVDKTEGSQVIGGSMNLNGALTVQVSRVGADSTLAQIIAVMEEAQGKKAPIAKIADKVSAVFVPVVMAIAVVAALMWLVAGKELAFALQIFTSVLVIACPCALGLATPAAIMVGTGLGAAHGILIRSGEALEVAGKTTTVVLDKTGTVTQGKPRVTRIVTAEGIDEAELLELAGAAESVAQHPLAQAILSALKDTVPKNPVETAKPVSLHSKGQSLPSISDFENIPGKGIKAKLEDGGQVLVGSFRLMEENRLGISREMRQKEEELMAQGNTLVYVATLKQAEAAAAESGTILGLLAIADTIRESSQDAIKRLKAWGIKTTLLTGDNNRAAQFIGREIDVDQVIAEVLPQEKAQVIANLQRQGAQVMMVGDGINDAPALVQANTGVSIGGGSDIAVEAGDIILMKSDLQDVAKAITLSRLTVTNIRQNLFWAFLYNTIGIPVAAGILYPRTGILMTPMLAGLAMSLSSVCVVSNALRLKTKKL